MPIERTKDKEALLESIKDVFDRPSLLYNKPAAARDVAEAILWLLDHTPSEDDLKGMVEEDTKVAVE